MQCEYYLFALTLVQDFFTKSYITFFHFHMLQLCSVTSIFVTAETVSAWSSKDYLSSERTLSSNLILFTKRLKLFYLESDKTRFHWEGRYYSSPTFNIDWSKPLKRSHSMCRWDSFSCSNFHFLLLFSNITMRYIIPFIYRIILLRMNKKRRSRTI